jgi:threonine dehydrogenase-like Zn-dependent dehydrogenase
MKALWHINKEESRIKSVAALPDFHTTIKSLYSLVSFGTERLVAKGLVPESMMHIMEVPYMEGNLTLPVKYGYSMVGSIINSNELDTGTIIHTMHPHQDIIAIEAKHATIVPIEIPTKRAILVSNMETVINAIWDANLQHGQRVLIAGYGTIGALLARICKNKYACDVYLLETDEDKKDIIKLHGYKDATKDPIAFDVAFNCTANEKALQFCIDHIGEESSVIELSWYGTRKVSLQLGGTFHSMRKKIISSQVSKIPISKRNEWTYTSRKALAFDFLNDTFFDHILTDEIPFEESAHFFNEMRNKKSSGIGYYIKY